MKVYYSPYCLEPLSHSALHFSQEGVLLSFEGEQGEISYSLYHPIESLGDVPLKNFISDFQNLLSGPLREIKTRALGQSIFERETSEKVKTYISLKSPNAEIDVYREKGFKFFKLKVKDFSFLDQADFYFEKGLKFILDFSACGSAELFEGLASKELEWLEQQCHYIEDPVPDVNFKTSAFKLASDFVDYPSAELSVVKPTAFCHSLNIKKERQVVTSYLDHPLGQLISAFWALDHNIKEPCGIWSHLFYKENSYSDLFSLEPSFSFSSTQDFLGQLRKENWMLLGDLG